MAMIPCRDIGSRVICIYGGHTGLIVTDRGVIMTGRGVIMMMKHRRFIGRVDMWDDFGDCTVVPLGTTRRLDDRGHALNRQSGDQQPKHKSLDQAKHHFSLAQRPEAGS